MNKNNAFKEQNKINQKISMLMKIKEILLENRIIDFYNN